MAFFILINRSSLLIAARLGSKATEIEEFVENIGVIEMTVTDIMFSCIDIDIQARAHPEI
jgi:hypothetical protein